MAVSPSLTAVANPGDAAAAAASPAAGAIAVEVAAVDAVAAEAALSLNVASRRGIVDNAPAIMATASDGWRLLT